MVPFLAAADLFNRMDQTADAFQVVNAYRRHS
jgi:hypothetical protein